MCKECDKARHAAYRERNRDKINDKARTRRATLEGCLSDIYASAKCRANTDGLPFNLPPRFLLDEWERQDGLCAVTSIPMHNTQRIDSTSRLNDFRPSPDRIIPSLGYVVGNVRLVCWFVNQMKWDRTDAEFHRLVHLLAKKV